MKKELLDKAHELLNCAQAVDNEIQNLENEIAFIKLANRHKIIVERVDYITIDKGTDACGWDLPSEMKEKTIVREYTIDKDILIAALEQKIVQKVNELNEWKRKFSEL